MRGRNAISWEGKLATDLEYVERVTFMGDLKIVLQTVVKFVKREDISAEGMETAEDLGDYLLRTGQVEQAEYDRLQQEAKDLLAGKTPAMVK